MSPLQRSDAEELFRVRGDAEAMKYWDWPHDKSRIVTASVVEALLAEVAAGEAHYWTLRLKANQDFVGLCDLSNLGASSPPEVGFMLAKEYWGLGLAQETVAVLVEQARALRLISLAARIHSDNERCSRLLKRAGFQEVQAASQLEIRPGVFRSCTRFSLML
jgi:ribosomal-protein-alanine N-acetyltransferase